MVKSSMNDCITMHGAFFHTVRIIEVATMHFCTGFDQSFGSTVRAGQSEYLVASLQKLLNDSRSYESRSSCNEYTHK